MLRALGWNMTEGGGKMELDARVNLIATTELDTTDIVGTLVRRIESDWRPRNPKMDDPRLFIADDILQVSELGCAGIYKQWMGEPKHVGEYIIQRHHIALMRFRLCVCGDRLEVNWPSGRQRDTRTCPMCMEAVVPGVVEDEKHIFRGVLIDLGSSTEQHTTGVG